MVYFVHFIKGSVFGINFIFVYFTSHAAYCTMPMKDIAVFALYTVSIFIGLFQFIVQTIFFFFFFNSSLKTKHARTNTLIYVAKTTKKKTDEKTEDNQRNRIRNHFSFVELQKGQMDERKLKKKKENEEEEGKIGTTVFHCTVGLCESIACGVRFGCIYIY